jgi:YD repeat-containing protein
LSGGQRQTSLNIVTALRRTAVACLFAATVTSHASTIACAQRPATDSSFAGLVARLSEPNGYFDSDNIITNEASYLHVSSQLEKMKTRGGVYVGVGPDQNFSYIAMIRPQIAFMFDIRRDNLLEHLLFKSLFAMSRNRLEYLCLLLGKPVPPDIERWTGRSMSEVLAYIGDAKTDSNTAAATKRESNDRITRFGIRLDARDREMIDRYRAQFVYEGIDTRYSSLGRNNRFDYPSFGRLIAETDRAGRQISYLADERAFQFVKSLQASDRIVPVVGNLAGDKALRAVAAYAREHGLHVSALYVSNVEQYLMNRDGGFDVYARNVSTLPRDSSSVIIRSYFGRFGTQHPLHVPSLGNISTSIVEPMDSFVRAFNAGELSNYTELVLKRYVTP